jgi:hypothetical protein
MKKTPMNISRPLVFSVFCFANAAFASEPTVLSLADFELLSSDCKVLPCDEKDPANIGKREVTVSFSVRISARHTNLRLWSNLCTFSFFEKNAAFDLRPRLVQAPPHEKDAAERLSCEIEKGGCIDYSLVKKFLVFPGTYDVTYSDLALEAIDLDPDCVVVAAPLHLGHLMSVKVEVQ